MKKKTIFTEMKGNVISRFTLAQGSGCSGVYRYGFNTQEKTDEIAGEGNHTTAKYWEYDTRIGRRWNLDPVFNRSKSG